MVLTFPCLNKLFLLYQKIENTRSSVLNFKSFSPSLEHFFLIVGQNNFGNKIPYFWKLSGWRPSFKYYNKWISLFGTILCIAVMFLMSYVTALITLVCIVLLYVFIKSRKPDVNWGSSTQSQHFITALKSVQYLTKVEDHVKNFRSSVIYVPKCWVDLSFNSRVILDFFFF